MSEFLRSVPVLVCAALIATTVFGSIQFAILFAAFTISGTLAICATLANPTPSKERNDGR